MKKCPKCGTILDDSKKKCYMCGAQLSGSVGSFGDTFNTQIGADVATSSGSVLDNNDDFSFKSLDVSKNNDGAMFSDDFYSSEINKLNSMEYDERSDLQKGFDSVFKQGDSFKSKDDELKKKEEAALKQKQLEEEAQKKKAEKERIAKEKLLKKERDKQRALQEKEQREREKAERAEALRLEKEQKEKERLEKAEELRLQKEEKERQLAEEKAKQKELLLKQKEEEARIAEQKRVEFEKKKQEEAKIAEQQREFEMQAKAEAREKQRLEKQKNEEEKILQKQFAEQERMRKQEQQAEAMRIERDNAFLKKIETSSKKEQNSKPSINWGDGLIDSNVAGYEDKINKANKKVNMSSIFNFLCVVFFIGAMVFVYFNYLRPDDNKDVNLGGLIYTVDEDFKLSNNDGATKYYTYGESCGLRVTYGATNDTDGFVENYLNEVKTQYENDMNSFTEKSSLKINGNTWSELSVIYLEDGATATQKENILKYRYVSIVYKGNFYHTVFVNPSNDKKCYEMYEDFIQTMKFE